MISYSDIELQQEATIRAEYSRFTLFLYAHYRRHGPTYQTFSLKYPEVPEYYSIHLSRVNI
jgi:hypothetical protein